jgi:hypothetical protein
MSVHRVNLLICRCLDPESADVYMLKNFSKVDDTTEKSKEGDNVKLVDPVRWYGLLSPQSLRDAQSRFVQGISMYKIPNHSA